MKIKDGFVLREVAGNYIVVAIGAEAISFNGMISLNETGADLWKLLEKGAETKEDLLEGLKAEYAIEPNQEADVKADIDAFIEKLNKAELLK